MKNEKGITLIALIITIIVMLILVGVTINVALNGGLFKKANTASKQTQRQVNKEELIVAMATAYNNRGIFVPGDVELPEGALWCTEDDTIYTEVEQDQDKPTNWVITENGNKFYINESGSVLDEKPQETQDPIVGSYAGSLMMDGDTIVMTYTFLANGNGTMEMTMGENSNMNNFTWEKIDGDYYITMNQETNKININTNGFEVDGLQCDKLVSNS